MDFKDQRERALLIGAQEKKSRPLLGVEESLDELAQLSDTAGVNVVTQLSQRLDRIDSATYIGSGKVEEARLLIEELELDLVIFDDELSPRHQRELEKAFGETVRLLDRTALILDIFAQHAKTREGQLQVELAQLEYRLPRLTRMWTHLARQAGGRAGGSTGGVGLRGPGETQLEVDRRMIGQRISRLKSDLEKVRQHRDRYRTRRQRREIPVVAIVGYTNAGKSTLLNQLSGASVLTADQLFATLDPTTRQVEMPSGQTVLFTDTVGFIQKLPTMLVASFRATLEEIADADLILHLIDVTHPHALAQSEAVFDTLAELEVDTIPLLIALNKTDALDDDERMSAIQQQYATALSISARYGNGIEQLKQKIDQILFAGWAPIDILIPYQEGALSALIHREGNVEQENITPDGIHIIGRIPERFLYHFKHLSGRDDQ